MAEPGFDKLSPRRPVQLQTTIYPRYLAQNAMQSGKSRTKGKGDSYGTAHGTLYAG